MAQQPDHELHMLTDPKLAGRNGPGTGGGDRSAKYYKGDGSVSSGESFECVYQYSGHTPSPNFIPNQNLPRQWLLVSLAIDTMTLQLFLEVSTEMVVETATSTNNPDILSSP